MLGLAEEKVQRGVDLRMDHQRMLDQPNGPLVDAVIDAENNRQRIIKAAREVFATHGVSAGLNDVAHHSGLGVGTWPAAAYATSCSAPAKVNNR